MFGSGQVSVMDATDFGRSSSALSCFAKADTADQRLCTVVSAPAATHIQQVRSAPTKIWTQGAIQTVAIGEFDGVEHFRALLVYVPAVNT
eukprot:SAG31_NODE_10367_length_1147_cov_1.631679_1_plen_90_part_00